MAYNSICSPDAYLRRDGAFEKDTMEEKTSDPIMAQVSDGAHSAKMAWLLTTDALVLAAILPT